MRAQKNKKFKLKKLAHRRKKEMEANLATIDNVIRVHPKYGREYALYV